ncbi:hypothetical protein D3C86_1430540 [compost metagenome]
MVSAVNTATIVSTIASVRNWITKELLVAPIVFLMPTSLALRSDFAVAIFMKLMQAISKIPKANPTNR